MQMLIQGVVKCAVGFEKAVEFIVSLVRLYGDCDPSMDVPMPQPPFVRRYFVIHSATGIWRSVLYVTAPTDIHDSPELYDESEERSRKQTEARLWGKEEREPAGSGV